MARVLDNSELRERMQSDGLAQAAGFSWENTARQTVDSYRRALTPAEEIHGV
jgi:glycosyltransferase involved in cell wall biosynthesis